MLLTAFSICGLYLATRGWQIALGVVLVADCKPSLVVIMNLELIATPRPTFSKTFLPALFAVAVSLVPVEASADYQSSVLSQAPVGYWRLDETAAVPLVLATNIGSVGAAGHGTHENDLMAGAVGALPAQGATNLGVRAEFFL